jgi:ribosomal-protein-alanine N-acetyltransferase
MATFETRRLILRPYRLSDRAAFHTLVRDDAIMWRLSGALSEESASRLFDRLLGHDASSGCLGWAVTTKADGAYCGHVFIDRYRREERYCELGFVLAKSVHGRGLGTETATAIYRYARETLGCDVVTATVDEDNEPSKAVLARIGLSPVERKTDSDGVYVVYSDRTAG